METLQTSRPCPACAEPLRPVDAIVVALTTILAMLVVAALVRWLGHARLREGFASARARELCSASRELFDRTRGGASYAAFKSAAGGEGTDAVQYSDLHGLWQSGGLTPEAVQKVM